MATKATFSVNEWQVLQWAVADTMTLLSMADPGFWDTFKETTAAAKFISGARVSSESALVRDLAGDARTKRDKSATATPTDMADRVAERVGFATQLVADKAPEDLQAFKEFIVGVARATAEAAGGVGPSESAAIARIETALG